MFMPVAHFFIRMAESWPYMHETSILTRGGSVRQIDTKMSIFRLRIAPSSYRNGHAELLKCRGLEIKIKRGGNRMPTRNRFALLMIVLAACCILSACSGTGKQEIDPEAVEAHLATIPEVITAGAKAEFTATFTGMEADNEVTVNFDVRIDGEPVLFKAYYKGDGKFTGAYTFEKSGTYDLYIHTYVEDLHLIFKKSVEVK